LHEGFLRHARFRWLKVALVVSLVAILAYVLIDAKPHPNGGTPLGYTLGTIGALLILWLTLLGLRKRAMTRGRWSLKAWTSAHVYLGLSLIVIATLHTGFEFGWNVHTLAYALMLLVILSGIYGISVYVAIPKALSNNREEMTQTQMLDALRAVDRQLHDAAQPLTQRQA
jgi:TctA family transporter